MTDIIYSVHRLMNICSVNISDAFVHIPGMKKCNHISHRGYGQDSWDNKIDRRTKDEVRMGETGCQHLLEIAIKEFNWKGELPAIYLPTMYCVVLSNSQTKVKAGS